MAYRKDSFSSSQFLAALRLCFPTHVLHQAVASNGRSTRTRQWPLWLLLWTLIASFFQASWGLASIAHWLRFLARGLGVPTDQALSQSRARLGWKPVWWIRRNLVRWLADPARDPQAFYRGRRLLAVDGTTFTVADTPANDRTFGRSRNQYKASGFPLVRVAALCELGTHAFIHWVARRYRSSEKDLVARLLRHMPVGSLLLGDRNFHSYSLWERAKQQGFDLLLRVASGPIFPVLERLADGSYRSEIRPRKRQANKGKPPIPVRVITYEIQKESEVVTGRLVTSLLTEAAGPAQELAELYAQRWEHETAFKELKGELSERVTHLLCHSPRLVMQELDALFLGHYVVRAMILQAARTAGVAPVEISFAKTVRVIQMRLGALPGRAGDYARWYQSLVDEIAALPRRKRRQRSYPRVRKVVRCAWPVKKPHHQQDKPKPLKQRLKIIP
jgi:Transposase DDE domain/Insertion element 4 transposase N-terminal